MKLSAKVIEAAARAYDEGKDAFFERDDNAFRMGPMKMAILAALEAMVAEGNARESNAFHDRLTDTWKTGSAEEWGFSDNFHVLIIRTETTS